MQNPSSAFSVKAGFIWTTLFALTNLIPGYAQVPLGTGIVEFGEKTVVDFYSAN